MVEGATVDCEFTQRSISTAIRAVGRSPKQVRSLDTMLRPNLTCRAIELG
jgi:hypothetical protein